MAYNNEILGKIYMSVGSCGDRQGLSYVHSVHYVETVLANQKNEEDAFLTPLILLHIDLSRV